MFCFFFVGFSTRLGPFTPYCISVRFTKYLVKERIFLFFFASLKGGTIEEWTLKRPGISDDIHQISTSIPLIQDHSFP